MGDESHGPGNVRDTCNAASRPNATSNLFDLPEHLTRLSAPLQVWEYIRFLQAKVRDLEARLG